MRAISAFDMNTLSSGMIPEPGDKKSRGHAPALAWFCFVLTGQRPDAIQPRVRSGSDAALGNWDIPPRARPSGAAQVVSPYAAWYSAALLGRVKVFCDITQGCAPVGLAAGAAPGLSSSGSMARASLATNGVLTG
jgi:hypothetical protein